MKFVTWKFFEYLSRKFRFVYSVTKIRWNLHEDLLTFMIIYRWILVRMRNVSDKYCRQNRNTFCIQLLSRRSCRLFDSVENMVEPDKTLITTCIRRVNIAWWMTKSTDSVRLSQLFDEDAFYVLICGLLLAILSSFDCRLLHRKANSNLESMWGENLWYDETYFHSTSVKSEENHKKLNQASLCWR
jgi:hypothetical protein